MVKKSHKIALALLSLVLLAMYVSMGAGCLSATGRTPSGGAYDIQVDVPHRETPAPRHEEPREMEEWLEPDLVA